MGGVRRTAQWLLVLPAGMVIGLFLVGPLTWLLPLSFMAGGGQGTSFAAGVTMLNYAQVLGDGFYLLIFLRTCGMAVAVTVLCVLLGWPLAYFLWQVGPRFRSALTLGVVAPLLVSIPVRNYGWMIILGDNGLLNTVLRTLGLIAAPLTLMYTQLAVIIALTHVLLPFVVLSVLASLEKVGTDLPEAAATLGAARLPIIRRVLWPLSTPGVVAGSSLVFCTAVSAYVTPALMGPSGSKYAAVLIYQQFVSAFNWPRGASLATVLLVLTSGFLLLFLRQAGRADRRIQLA